MKQTEKKLTTPVLFIIFNRPDYTQKVFEAIRIARPSKLYVAADGPREDVEGDLEATQQTRKIIEQVDWNCELKTKFESKNLGCGPGPASAISWIFEHEDRAIILEDDCVPAQSFFPYCDELLEKYKNDNRVWLISGNNYNEEKQVSDYSYFFSYYMHIWGWATWKRCWDHFDSEMKTWPQFIKTKRIYDIFPTKMESYFFVKKYNRVYADKTSLSHIWDYQFNYLIRSNGGLCIIPQKNLVKNVGYLGTHIKRKHYSHDRPVDPNYTIKKHPEFVLQSKSYDTYHFYNHWMRITLINVTRLLKQKLFYKISKPLINLFYAF